MAKKKKPGKPVMSEKERARRAAAAAEAREHDQTAPKKFGGPADHHSSMGRPRIIRHQGR